MTKWRTMAEELLGVLPLVRLELPRLPSREDAYHSIPGCVSMLPREHFDIPGVLTELLQGVHTVDDVVLVRHVSCHFSRTLCVNAMRIHRQDPIAFAGQVSCPLL